MAPAGQLAGRHPVAHPQCRGYWLLASTGWPRKTRALLQTLAVLGRECALQLLTQVVDQPEAVSSAQLADLQAAELLYEQPGLPGPKYVFKHALTQDVAYASLPHERRREVHARAAQAIEVLFPDRLGEHYSALAHHYSRSGNTAKAVYYLQQAGHQAEQRSAYAEAISHLTRALELLPDLPDTPERPSRNWRCRPPGSGVERPRAMRPRKWNTPMPGPLRCVSRSGRRRSSSRCCGGLRILPHAGGVPDGAGRWRSSSSILAQRPRPGLPPGGAPGAGESLVSGRVGRPRRTSRRA